MEKNTLFTLVIFSAMLSPLLSKAQLTFEKTFGGHNDDWAQTAILLPDSSFVYTGITYSWGHGGEDFLMVKTDKHGDTLWMKTFGGPLDDYGYRIEKMHKGFIIVGHTDSFGAGDCDGWVVRTDDNGDTLWTKAYGGINDDVIHGVAELPGGDIMLAGYTENFGAIQRDVFLLRTDSNGNVKWMKTIGGPGSEVGECLALTPDGNVLIGGSTTSYGAGIQNYYIIKTDTGGNIIWQKTFGKVNNNDQFWNMQITADGGAILAGCSIGTDTLKSRAYIVKIDRNGQQQWETFYGNSVCTSARYIKPTADGGYIVTGDIKPDCDSLGIILLFKLDSAGTVLWQKTFGEGQDNNGNYVTETLDGQILVLGRTVSYAGFGAGLSDCYIIKTDNSGNPVNSISNIPGILPVLVYPNPSQGQLNIKTGWPVADGYIEIADVQGKVVFGQKLAGENTTVNVQQLAPGTYCYRIVSGTQMMGEGKFALMK